VGRGAVRAGCEAFFGYPRTPQNEITEWFARELPKRGGVFVQSQCETGTINMLFGAGVSGVRVMSSTSGPGWGLMQETMANLTAGEIPCVIVLVQRGGTPGAPSVAHAQADYLSATRGGGGGGYRNIVLAPASVQEIYDLIQLAFYLADKYRNPVVMLLDAIIAHLMEVVEERTIEFPPLPEKDWALRGKGRHRERKRGYHSFAQASQGRPPFPTVMSFAEHWNKRLQEMKNSEVRCKAYQAEDAELVLVAYGYTGRVAREAVNLARQEGIRAGLIHPITLWPFPQQPILEAAARGAKFLVVEDSLGQMVEDVELAVRGKTEVHHLGFLARHLPTTAGMILPDRVYAEIKRLRRG